MTHISRFFSTIALTTGLLTVSGALAEDTLTADTVLAQVGDTQITLAHMIALRSSLPAQYAQIPADLIFPGMLEQFINHALLAEAHDGDMSALSKLSLENETRALLAEETAQTISAKAVTEEAIKKAYDDDYANAPAQAEYHAAHILVKTEDEAKALVTELENGADFAELAKEKSTGPSGPDGGDLGWFSEGMMVAPFYEATLALKAGEISGPVQTDFGWHVINLIETREKPVPPLEEVSETIISQLQQQAVTAYIDELKKDITIEQMDMEGVDMSIIDDTSLLEN